MPVAAVLLAGSAIPVRDVARLVGYRQAPHFARAFRRRYGISPARFRAQARARERRRTSPPPGPLPAVDWPAASTSATPSDAGQAQAHQRAAARGRLGGDGAAVLLGDLAHDRQAEARARRPRASAPR